MIDDKELLERARAVRKQAHAPYSNYRVGAAIVDDNGNVHVGCNVENSSYPEGNCAETSAIAAMVAAGGRRIVTIAVIADPVGAKACTPCGGCRQRINEFADADTRIILLGTSGELVEYSINNLLPASFSLR
jgi:cytidine deaminase